MTLLPLHRTQIHVKVTRLIEVNAPSYFEVDAQISISWEDPRIVVQCTGILPGEAATSSVCDLNWKPTVRRPQVAPRVRSSIASHTRESLFQLVFSRPRS